MKKIWIDGYEANVPQRLGSGQVAYEVIKSLASIDKKNDYTVLVPTAPKADMPKERDGFKYKILKPNKLWTRIALPFALFKTRKRPDVIFTPTHYIPRFSPVKRVVTVFDLSYIHYPQMFTKRDLWQLSNWTKFSIQNSDHIITISQASKKDILKTYLPKNSSAEQKKLFKDKITVAYPGFDSNLFKPIKDTEKIEKVKKKYGIEGNYVIYTGTIQPRKNLIRLIDAFARVPNLKLVIVGKTKGEGRQGWMFEDILKRPKELGIEDKVIFTGFAPSEDLPYLVNGAVAFILPSLYEGFGIPVVEAMACGTPVIVSNVSSLPEIVGKAGLLIDPKSTDQIEQAIRTINADKKLRIKLSKLALEQSKKFSWKKFSKEVIKVLESV